MQPVRTATKAAQVMRYFRDKNDLSAERLLQGVLY
jgi:hypothetical protein